MIVRKISELKGTEREVHSTTWVSTRLLLKKDGMGFSFHETIIHGGTVTEMEYRNHLEAVYCVAGRGELRKLPDGPTWTLEPGTMYALNEHDHHVVTAHDDLRLLCVFNPPVTGREVHDETGAYPLIEDDAEDVLGSTVAG